MPGCPTDTPLSPGLPLLTHESNARPFPHVSSKAHAVRVFSATCPREGIFNTSAKVIIWMQLFHLIKLARLLRKGVSMPPSFSHLQLMGNFLPHRKGRDPTAAGHVAVPITAAPPQCPPLPLAANKIPYPPFLCPPTTTLGFPHLCTKTWRPKDKQKEHIAVIALLPRHPFHARKHSSCPAIPVCRNPIIVHCTSTPVCSGRGNRMMYNKQYAYRYGEDHSSLIKMKLS